VNRLVGDMTCTKAKPAVTTVKDVKTGDDAVYTRKEENLLGQVNARALVNSWKETEFIFQTFFWHHVIISVLNNHNFLFLDNRF